jgi:PAS domain S-box-containing protein
MTDERLPYRKSDPGGGSGDEYRLLVGAVVEYAIFLLDTEGRVASWNPGAERIKGYSRAEIIGESFTRFYPPEDIALGKPARALETAREHGRYEEEGWRVRKNGEYFWANVLITALRDGTGALKGFGKLTRDLTERRQAEEVARELIAEQAARRAAEQGEVALRASERRYRELSARFEATLEGVTDGITVQDREGRIVYANSSAARQCGAETPEQLMNTPGAAVRGLFELLDEQVFVEGAPPRDRSALVVDRPRASGARSRRWR